MMKNPPSNARRVGLGSEITHVTEQLGLRAATTEPTDSLAAAREVPVTCSYRKALHHNKDPARAKKKKACTELTSIQNTAMCPSLYVSPLFK